MKEQQGQVTFQGDPLTLVGELPQTGQPAPKATLIDNDLNEAKLSDYIGKIVILSVVPSLDTSVCAAQTRRFNEEAAALKNVVVLGISMDLPFAQKRWCGAEGIENVHTLSDHRDEEFGLAYGLLIKELRLLARAVLVLNSEGIIRYVQLVREITDEPDYDPVLQAVREVSGT